MTEYFDGNRAIAEAQKCRQMLQEQTGSKSTWCIVTKKGFWPASYLFPGDEERVRQKLNQGHDILLVFAAGPRHVLTGRTDYRALSVASADPSLRRYARRAMKRPTLNYRCLSFG